MGRHLFFFFVALLFILSSCRRDDDFITDSSAKLAFSADSIAFDTVFTTIGSVTKNIRVYNPHKEAIRISSIQLLKGNQSNFRINVDGQPGVIHRDVEIAAEDSMFIFIEVTVDPSNQLNPFVIEDAISFSTNGNVQNVRLVAWGQNAIYYTPTRFFRNLPDISCLTGPNGLKGPCDDLSRPPVNVTWTDSLPIVIYGYVFIDSLDVLNINAGTQVHFHPGGGLWVYHGGNLKVNGTKDKPVVFQGDRLEPGFEDRPGQWDRIWINNGGQNEINYAIIKNGFIGIQAEAIPFEVPDTNNIGNLLVRNTIIDNCSGFGLLTNIFNVAMQNTVISNCGEYNVAIQSYGNYQFVHCTFANYFNKASRETPSFFVQNSVVNALGLQIVSPPNVQVYNSIIDGDKADEFETEVINNGSINLDFRSVAIKSTKNLNDTSQFKDMIVNPGNLFLDIGLQDFSLNETSAAIDAGNSIIANQVRNDIKGEDRTVDNGPDLGAYEFKP